MQMNNISRFLFESALYLDLDPAPVFRALGADEGLGTDSESDMAGAGADNDGVCRPVYKRPHPNLLPEREGLLSAHLPDREGLVGTDSTRLLRPYGLAMTGTVCCA